MSFVTSKHPSSAETAQTSVLNWRSHLNQWLLTWELPLILLLAAFLRFYRLDTTEFDGDQADIFRMAYDAVHHGMLVAASNMASIHIYNPPAIIYILMLPAAFSANPFWAAVLVATLSTLSVLLTYAFTRAYYGRLAGALAALLYATAALPVFYSRFIWQQNLLLFFVPLFLITLFEGTVRRRKGWLFPALFLLGLLVQLHASTIILSSALLVAWVLAPGTVRWRDLALGALSLLVIYLPYLLWENAYHYQDVAVLVNEMKQQSKIDVEAITLYQQFLSPYSARLFPRSLLNALAPFVSWLTFAMTLLVIVAGIAALAVVLSRGDRVEARSATGVGKVWEGLRRWWLALRDDPYRCGLLVLLVWQGVPLLYLSRHAIPLFPHYFIMLMPGPFILIGILLAKALVWLRQLGRGHRFGQAALYLLAGLLILAQCAATTANVLDMASGRYQDTVLSYPYYNDLTSLRQTMQAADQLAQQRHLGHLYVATDFATETALRYMVTLTRTPATAFSDPCLVLPDPAQGPVALLLGPRSDLDAALLPRFTSATLVETLPHLGGPPFHLYIVQSATTPQAPRATFSGELGLLNAPRMTFDNTPWGLTHWQILRAVPPAFRTRYVYTLTNLSSTSHNEHVNTRQCTFTSMRAGDQLLVAFPLSRGEAVQPSIDIRATAYDAKPFIVTSRLGLSFETGFYLFDSQRTLQTSDGQDFMAVPF